MAILNEIGLAHAWDKMKAYFQPKELGKGLSTNDYTTEEKTKLADLENFTLPIATETVLGGVKAIPKTTEVSQVSVDTDGTLWSASENVFDGTLGEWNTLTDEQKNQYTIAYIV